MFFWIKDARFVVISSSFLLLLPSSPDGLSWGLVCSYFPLGEDFSSSVFMAAYGPLCTEGFSWVQHHFTNGSKEGWATAECTLCFCVHFIGGTWFSKFLLDRFPFWDTLCPEWHSISAATKLLWNSWVQRPCYQNPCFFVLFWSVLCNEIIKKFYSKSREKVLEFASSFCKTVLSWDPIIRKQVVMKISWNPQL